MAKGKATKKNTTELLYRFDKVKIRGRYNGSGEYISLYLDYQENRKRKQPFYEQRIFAKPKTPDQVKHNETVLKKAKEWANQTNLLLLNDTQIKTAIHGKINFVTFFNEYRDSVTAEGDKREYQTKLMYNSVLNKYREFDSSIDKMTLEDVTTDWLWKLRSFLLENLEKGSALVYWSKIGAVLKHAHKLDYIEKNPILKVDGIGTPEVSINFLLMPELRQLKNTECEIPDLKKAGLFSSRTGLRAGDCMALRWKHIEFSKEHKKYYIHLDQEKTDFSHMVFFNQKVMDILGTPGESDDLVFPKFKNRERDNYALKNWLLRAEIKKEFTFHDFRHSFAIDLGLKGTDIYTISRMLGHKSIQTTEKYYHRVLNHLKALKVDLLDDL